MSFIVWIVLGSIAIFVASKLVNRRTHSLALAAALVIASASWASPSSAAQATALTLARTTDGVRSVVGDLTVKGP